MEHPRPLTHRSFERLLEEATAARSEGVCVLRERDGTRHGVWVRDGMVVGVHVAGRHDPLLARLLRAGSVSERGLRCGLETGSRLGLRSGRVATELLGVPAGVVREALRLQAVERFEALCELAGKQGHDAWLEPRRVPPDEQSVLFPLGSLRRRAEALRRPTALAEPDSARKRLRQLARKLHPDCHPELTPAQRARLERELSEATAAYHGFG